jgi:hypothetical protein
MRRLLIGALLLAGLPAAGASADDKDKPKPVTPAAELQALLAEYDKASDALYEALPGAKPDERDKIYEKIKKLAADYAQRVFAFAEKHAKDRDAVLDALVWLVRNSEGSPEGAKAVDWIIRDYLTGKTANRNDPLNWIFRGDRVVRDYLNEEKIDSLLAGRGYGSSEQGEKLLRAAATKIDDPPRKARARFFLARNLKNRSEVVQQLKGDEAAKLLKEAEDLFDSLAKENGDVKVFGQTIKELAEPELFEIRHLAIGKPAPEIEGEDIDGKTFKLSEYKGKVVVLDFWGHW